LKDVTNTKKGKEKQVATFEMVRKPAIERIFPPLSVVKGDLAKDDDEITSNFTKMISTSSALCQFSQLNMT